MHHHLPLRPGQALSIRWRDATGTVLDTIRRLKLDPTKNGTSVEVSSYVSFVDARGISVHIVRGMALGGDIKGFIDTRQIQWQSWFRPLASILQPYAASSHALKRFPQDFL